MTSPVEDLPAGSLALYPAYLDATLTADAAVLYLSGLGRGAASGGCMWFQVARGRVQVFRVRTPSS